MNDESWSAASVRRVFEAIDRIQVVAASDVAAMPPPDLGRMWWEAARCPGPSWQLASLLGALKSSKHDRDEAEATLARKRAAISVADAEAVEIAAASAACIADTELDANDDADADADADNYDIYGNRIQTAAEEDAAKDAVCAARLARDEASKMQVVYHTLERRLLPVAMEWRMRALKLDSQLEKTPQIVLPRTGAAAAAGSAAAAVTDGGSVCFREVRMYNAKPVKSKAIELSTAKHRVTLFYKRGLFEGLLERTVNVELRTMFLQDFAPGLIGTNARPRGQSTGGAGNAGAINKSKKRDKKTERAIAEGNQKTLNMFFTAKQPMEAVGEATTPSKKECEQAFLRLPFFVVG